MQQHATTIICSNMDGTGSHYVKQSELGTERQISHSSMGDKKVVLMEVESRVIDNRGWEGYVRGWGMKRCWLMDTNIHLEGMK